MSSDGADRKPRILLVDDDSAITKIMVVHLRDNGFDAMSCNESRKTLDVLDEYRPDMMVLDIMMPVLNGFEVLERVRKTKIHREIPVLMLSAVTDKRGIMMAAKLGVSGYMVKPFTPKALIDKLVEVLSENDLPLPANAEAPAKESDDRDEPEEQKEAEEGQKDYPASVLQDISKVDELPTMPFIVTEVNQALGDDKLNAGMLARIVEKDQGITGQLLKLANSVHYGQVREVKTPDQAIVVLGYREVTEIVVSLSLIKAFSIPEGQSGISHADFWAHSFAVGCLTRHLADAIGYQTPNDTFVAGIMHDFGKYICNVLCRTIYHETLAQVIERRTLLEEVEMEFLETHHRKLGGQLGRYWDLPTLVRCSMRLHDSWRYPNVENADDRRALGLVYIADHFARAAGFGKDGEVLIENVPTELWEAINVKKPQDVRPAVIKAISSWGRFMNELEMINFSSVYEDVSFLDPSKPDTRPPVLVLDERERPIGLPEFLMMTSGFKPVCLDIDRAPSFITQTKDLRGIVVTGRDPEIAKAFFQKIRSCGANNIETVPILYLREVAGGTGDEADLDPEIAAANHLEVLQEPFTRDEFLSALDGYTEHFRAAFTV